MAKVGRPPVEDKKYIKVGFRVTEAERDRLFAYCKKMNLTQVLFGKLNDAFSVTLNVAILC